MHAISSYHDNRPTLPRPPVANPQTGPITIQCTANLSAQCKNVHIVSVSVEVKKWKYFAGMVYIYITKSGIAPGAMPTKGTEVPRWDFYWCIKETILAGCPSSYQQRLTGVSAGTEPSFTGRKSVTLTSEPRLYLVTLSSCLLIISSHCQHLIVSLQYSAIIIKRNENKKKPQ